MLMGTGGNAGGQTSVTIIRGLALEEIRMRDILRILFKELRVSLLCGGMVAIATFVKLLCVDKLILKNTGITVEVALIVSLAILVVIIIAKIVGGLLPVLAKRIGLDPAVMASPFITTIVDAISLLVYFGIATAIII